MAMNSFWWLLVPYLVTISAVTYFAFWIDKERAQMGLYRIPERDLLLLAMLGGSPAAYFARRTLRHKTRKQPFGNQLFAILVIQTGAVTWLLVTWWN